MSKETAFPNSSLLDRMSHDSETEEMEVTFKRGGNYKYHPVSHDLWTELIESESVGKAFGYLIKSDPNITFEKLS